MIELCIIIRWSGRSAPLHRAYGLPSAVCPALRAVHQAAEADSCSCEQARIRSYRLSAGPLDGKDMDKWYQVFVSKLFDRKLQ